MNPDLKMTQKAWATGERLWSTFLLLISTCKKICRHSLQTLQHPQGLIFSLMRRPYDTHTNTFLLISIYSKWAAHLWNILWLRGIKTRWQCFPWTDSYCPDAHFSAPFFLPHTSVFLQLSFFLPYLSLSVWSSASGQDNAVKARPALLWYQQDMWKAIRMETDTAAGQEHTTTTSYLTITKERERKRWQSFTFIPQSFIFKWSN